MTPEELKNFANDIASPRMKKLLEKITLEDGECYIDNLSVEFIDGRSWGVDSLIKATGLVYEGGIVKEFKYEEYDVSVEEFVEANKGRMLLSDGKMDVKDELEQISLSGTIGSGILHFPKICDDLKHLKLLDCIPKPLEFYKMTDLLLKQFEADKARIENEQHEREEQFAKKQASRSPNEIGIEEFDLSVRAYKILRSNNISTLEDFLSYIDISSDDPYRKIREFRNIGNSAFREVVEKVGSAIDVDKYISAARKSSLDAVINSCEEMSKNNNTRLEREPNIDKER